MGVRVSRGLRFGAALLVAAAVFLVVNASTSAKPGPGGPPCRVTKTVTKAHVPTVVGEVNMAYRGGKTTFKYGASADSDISYAISVDQGPFHIGGTDHVSQGTSTAATVTHTGRIARQVVADFTYQRQKLVCKNRLNGEIEHIRHRVDAVGWEGNLGYGKQLHTLDRCVRGGPFTPHPLGANTSFSTTTERAHEWNSGASVFGVGLHATSGYSSFVQEAIQMPPQKGKYYFCGSDNVPNGATRVFTGLKQ
jgi:hypothetical protein